MDQADTASRDRVRQFVRRIVATEEHELDCRAVLDVIHAYVDMDLSGGDAVAGFPGIPHHLMQCPDCAEMVAALRHVASLEARGQLPAVDHLWRDLQSAVTPHGLRPPDRPLLSGP